MADTKVDLFPDLATIFDDTKIAGQTPGNGATASSFQIAFSAIRTWLISKGFLTGKTTSNSFPTGSTGTVTIPAGSLVSKIIITSTAAGTVNVGTSPSPGNDAYDAEPYVNGYVVLSNPDLYFASAGTLYFSGHAHTITVKTILIYV